ncbi:MAG: hypothetical protein QW799_00790 [Saccharolobus sp.]
MMGDAQRRVWKPMILLCSKCGFSHDRSVEYSLDVSLIPLGSKRVHDPSWSGW